MFFKYYVFPVTAVLLLALLFPPFVHAEAVGEFDIPAVIPLNTSQLLSLRELVKTDSEAAAVAEEIKKKALPLLDLEPSPLEVIYYEGLVNTDKKRIACVKKLSQMGDTAVLFRFWQAYADKRAAAKLRELITAWTGTYKLIGNDVNENKFYPLLVAYHALRDTFPEGERKQVDSWVLNLGKLHETAVEKSRHFTNRYTKHVRLLAICARILDKPEWSAEAEKGIKRFISASLYADGSSRDFKRRDTLTYHCSALKPVIELAVLSGDKGRELYTWESSKGGSLKKSVDFVVPYAMGEKTHKEWVNSKVGLDHRRAEAGIEKYRKGRLFEPKDAATLMERAAFFDPELMKTVLHLHAEKGRKRFPTWLTLINAAAEGQKVEIRK